MSISKRSRHSLVLARLVLVAAVSLAFVAAACDSAEEQGPVGGPSVVAKETVAREVTEIAVDRKGGAEVQSVVSASLVAAPAVSGHAAHVAPGADLARRGNAVVVHDGSHPLVLVVDASGQQLAAIETGAAPDAVVRNGTYQLLVSDTSPGFNASLTAFDLSRGLEERWSIRIPGRMAFNVHRPAMLLSEDDQTLYYMAYGPKDTAECVGATAATRPDCMVYGLGTVDLRQPNPAATTAELPPGCTPQSLQAAGAADALLACSGTNAVLRASPAGSLSLVAQVSSAPPSNRTGNPPGTPAGLFAAYARADGSLGLLWTSGDFWVVRNGQVADQARVAASDAFIFGTSRGETSNGVIAVAFGSGTAGLGEGFSLFDLNTLSIVAKVAASGSMFSLAGGADLYLHAGIVITGGNANAQAPLLRGLDATRGWALVDVIG